jgi:hypothetical protein
VGGEGLCNHFNGHHSNRNIIHGNHRFFEVVIDSEMRSVPIPLMFDYDRSRYLREWSATRNVRGNRVGASERPLHKRLFARSVCNPWFVALFMGQEPAPEGSIEPHSKIE